MRKLLAGIGIVLIVGMALLFAMRRWIFAQTLQAIAAATSSTVECKKIGLTMFSGQVHIEGLTLTAQRNKGAWERIDVATATGHLKWREWNSGTIPLEVELEGCSVQLRPIGKIQLPQVPSLAQSTPVTPPLEAAMPSSTQQRRITLTAVTARNVAIVGVPGQPPYATGINCSARRMLSGWQGSLTAERLGYTLLPLEQVQADFSNEEKGTRIANFQCHVANGIISGHGWLNAGQLATIDLEVNGLQLAAVAPSWEDTLSGKISGTFSFTGSPVQWKNSSLVGKFTLTDAALKLGKVSQALKLLGGSEFGGITLDTASGALTMDGTKWALSGLTLEKRGLVAIYGDLACNQETTITANLKLGVADHFLSRIAGGGGEGKLKWTEMQVETTPQELLATAITKLMQPELEHPQVNPTPQKNVKSAVNAVLNFLTQ